MYLFSKQVVYNDKKTFYIPKNSFPDCKTEAQLETFLKMKVFHVPAKKPVKLTFKPAGELQKQEFVEYFIAAQLSMARAVYMDDA